ncbi:hypothetical protein B566_EDAN009943 [Ephemera danica]|nr:hypothetical protein B566_EDAN009943 [Ephemera danica]
MTNYLGRKYKLVKSENFDDYMKALGVNMVLRKIGQVTSSSMQLLKNDDGSFTLRITSTWKNQDMIFRHGEEFDETTPDGRHCKTVMTLDETTLTQVQKGPPDSTIVRTWSDDKIITVFTTGDVVCTRTHQYVE